MALKPGQLTFEKTAWSVMVADIVGTEGYKRVSAIADACNAEAGLGDAGYIAGTEGNPSKTLQEDDFRATVITASEAAKIDNAANNRLVRNMHHGGGE